VKHAGKALFGVAVTVVLLWWALRGVSFADVWAQIRQGDPLLLTAAVAVAELVDLYGKTPVEHLGHPKYYNIAWMELLEQVRPAYQAMQNIFEPIEE
jgi:hypothetical protein